MNGLGDLSPDRCRRLDEAADWRLRLRRDPSLEFGAEFVAWIADTANADAYAAVEKGWNAVGALGTAQELLAMRQQALARVRKAGRRRGLRAPWLRAAAAVLAVFLLGAGAIHFMLTRPVAYVTDIGERRIVPLPDGSHVSMDSDTRILVDYSKTARALTLMRGRARFDVAHDVDRPFTVSAGTETVVAVGTSFDVERVGATVLVTLIQGQVVVKNEPATLTSRVIGKPRPSVSLSAGQQLVATPSAQPAVGSADLQLAAAWEAGHLVFRDERLDAVVARVNRYTEHPVKIDPAVAGIRISGVFNAGDVGSFVSALTAYEPVQATTTASGGILLQPRQ